MNRTTSLTPDGLAEFGDNVIMLLVPAPQSLLMLGLVPWRSGLWRPQPSHPTPTFHEVPQLPRQSIHSQPAIKPVSPGPCKMAPTYRVCILCPSGEQKPIVKYSKMETCCWRYTRNHTLLLFHMLKILYTFFYNLKQFVLKVDDLKSTNIEKVSWFIYHSQ